MWTEAGPPSGALRGVDTETHCPPGTGAFSDSLPLSGFQTGALTSHPSTPSHGTPTPLPVHPHPPPQTKGPGRRRPSTGTFSCPGSYTPAFPPPRVCDSTHRNSHAPQKRAVAHLCGAGGGSLGTVSHTGAQFSTGSSSVTQTQTGVHPRTLSLTPETHPTVSAPYTTLCHGWDSQQNSLLMMVLT